MGESKRRRKSTEREKRRRKGRQGMQDGEERQRARIEGGREERAHGKEWDGEGRQREHRGR